MSYPAIADTTINLALSGASGVGTVANIPSTRDGEEEHDRRQFSHFDSEQSRGKHHAHFSNHRLAEFGGRTGGRPERFLYA